MTLKWSLYKKIPIPLKVPIYFKQSVLFLIKHRILKIYHLIKNTNANNLPYGPGVGSGVGTFHEINHTIWLNQIKASWRFCVGFVLKMLVSKYVLWLAYKTLLFGILPLKFKIVYTMFCVKILCFVKPWMKIWKKNQKMLLYFHYSKWV